MKLAVNYSPQAAGLLASGDLEFDLFKCPGWPEVIEAAHRQLPARVHFPLRAGRGQFADLDWSEVEDLLAWTDTPYINLHLAPYAPDFPGMPIDTTDPCWKERLIEQVTADVRLVQRHFGEEYVTLENVSWDTSPGHAIPRPIIEPDVIWHIVHETGTHFLLNLAHARISALHLNVAPQDYVSALPLDRLHEIHVSGTAFETVVGEWRHHSPMSDEDWALAGWALERIGRGDWLQPEIVALEYGGVGARYEWRSNEAVLLRDVARLRVMAMLARAVRCHERLASA